MIELLIAFLVLSGMVLWIGVIGIILLIWMEDRQ
jgi:hypothetical protein